MELAVVFSRATLGIEAPLVRVETHLSNGLPSLTIVGLPETAVRESKDRVRSAIINSGFEFPQRRITINLAPADLPKIGGRFDLPIALSVLAASGQIPSDRLADHEFVGELALGGALRATPGILPAAIRCQEERRCLVVPAAGAEEAALIEGLTVLAAPSLAAATAYLQANDRQTKDVELKDFSDESVATATQPESRAALRPLPCVGDLRELKGQYAAKRALEIAAAGGHNLLLYGPPGTGKSMLASRLPSILPPLDEQQGRELAAIESVSAAGFDYRNWRRRPFRSPHHTASAVAIVGGGSHPKPGEISLAHHGVLFLDELPEFGRKVLEVLREPLEERQVTIARAHQSLVFPADFQLIAAMNPCPCGHRGDPRHSCHCSPAQVQRYRRRISGPVLDRIDMHVEMTTQSSELFNTERQEHWDSAAVAARVRQAQLLQYQRQQKTNARLRPAELEQLCRLAPKERGLLQRALEQLGLSARAHHRILKLARSIADLAGSETIGSGHLLEALSYRKLDRTEN